MLRRQITARIVNPILGTPACPLPDYATEGSAAMDLRACLNGPIELLPGTRVVVPTGLALDMADPSLVAIVASRSGLSLKHGVRVAQGIGVIDADYHGEIKVLLANDGTASYEIQPGERIAQLLFQPVLQVGLNIVDAFTIPTARGEGGFGSTGQR